MFAHRFKEHLQSHLPAIAGVGVNSAFVACPMFHTFSAMQLTQVQEIYRIAAERTQQQLRQRRRSRIPQFSLN